MNRFGGGNSQQRLSLHSSNFLFLVALVISPKNVNSSSLSISNQFCLLLPTYWFHQLLNHRETRAIIKIKNPKDYMSVDYSDPIVPQCPVLWVAPRAEQELESLLIADPSTFTCQFYTVIRIVRLKNTCKQIHTHA